MAQTRKSIRAAYDANTYKEHKFRVRKNSDLNIRIEKFKKMKGTSLNYLITKLLCDHFDESYPRPEYDN